MAASAEVVAELRYDLPATYKFHKLFPDLDSLHPLRPGRRSSLLFFPVFAAAVHQRSSSSKWRILNSAAS